MGSTPTHTIKADLNGTGVLVDITSYVDMQPGVRAKTGRSQWFSEQPTPGSLSLTLDNLTGRFTPGNTATYTVGMVNGCIVEWTCANPTAPTVVDEFARADATLDGSSAANGTQSATWATLSTSGTSVWRIVSQRALPSTGAEDTFAVIDLTRTDYTVAATVGAIHSTITNRRAGVVFAVQDHLNHYRFGPSPSEAAWYLERYDAGVATLLYRHVAAPAASDVVTVAVNSNQCTVTLNGATVTTVVLTKFMSQTRVGFFGRRYSTGTTPQDDVTSWERISVTVPVQRIRRYRAGTPALSFTGGVAGGSQVTVDCLDTLADLSHRRMRQMVDEVAFAQQPVAYWPLADSGAGVSAQAQDISGNAETPLVPVGDSTLFAWAQGVGPSTDGRAAVMLYPDATTAPANASAVRLTLAQPLGTSGVVHEWYIDADTPTPGNYGFGFSLWFSVRDIYGAASTTAATTDGPYVEIASVAGIEILWRIPDRRIVMYGVAGSMTALPDVPSCPAGGVNHVFVQVEVSTGADYVGVWVNGVQTAVSMGTPAGGIPTTVVLGGPSAPVGVGNFGYHPGGTGSDKTLYALSGTLACAAVYTRAATTLLVSGGDIPEFYPVGKTGPDETASVRFQRIGNYLRRTDVAFTPQGTPLSSLMGPQDTGGKSMLAAMCDALRFEEANLDTQTINGVDTVRAWLSDQNRPTTAALSVNVDADGQGVPVLSFDASGVAVQVEAKGFSTSVTWLDGDAPERWRDTSATLTAACDDVSELRALAQFRSLLGRVETIVPTKVTIDAVNSTAALTSALIALRPMHRITVTGLPSTVVGYSSIDCILTGVTERHTLGRSIFELLLTPDLPYVEWIVDSTQLGEIPEPYLFVADPLFSTHATMKYATVGQWGVGRWFPQLDPLSSGGTSLNMRLIGTGLDPPSDDWVFQTGALTDPVYLMIDSEIVKITNAAAQTHSDYVDTPTSTKYVWVSDQTLTIVRGQLGTTAVSHTTSGGELNSTVGVIHHGFLGLDARVSF